MKKIKKNIGKLLVLLCACLTVGSVVNAAGKASTSVDITIEADTTEQNQRQGTDNPEQKEEKVQTGDSAKWMKYAVALGAAVVAVVGCVWKKKKGMLAVFALAFTLLFVNNPVHAAEATDNVNVTIPTNISMAFNETGTNSISRFTVKNPSLVPITIENINVTECNDWHLSAKGEKIPVDTKRLVFEIENQALSAGENSVSIVVSPQTGRTLDIQVERGAWTSSKAEETAFQLELEYKIGYKNFKLRFVSDGNTDIFPSRMVRNGGRLNLPTPKKEGYAFLGWEDENGNVYTGQFIMPIGDVTLKAIWKETVAYAIYSATDTSLRFVRTADTIKVGDTYNGRVVTNLYTGFEEAVYTSENQVPWYDGNYYNNRIVTKIIFEDVIKPKSTAHWFQFAYDCVELDVTNLDTSAVTNMEYMFQCFAWDSKTLTITGINDWDVSKVTSMEWMFGGFGFNVASVVMDLSNWDVSQVTTMEYMCYQMAQHSTTFSIGNISGWNTSNVTDMYKTFYAMGADATWYLDLSQWNVNKVTKNTGFSQRNETRIKEPKWVN